MTYGEENGFYAYTGEVGEPTVIGHVSSTSDTFSTRANRLADDLGQDRL